MMGDETIGLGGGTSMGGQTHPETARAALSYAAAQETQSNDRPGRSSRQGRGQRNRRADRPGRAYGEAETYHDDYGVRELSAIVNVAGPPPHMPGTTMQPGPMPGFLRVQGDSV